MNTKALSAEALTSLLSLSKIRASVATEEMQRIGLIYELSFFYDLTPKEIDKALNDAVERKAVQ